MIYGTEITTPANTPESNPLHTAIKVVHGLIYKVSIYLYPGSMGLLYLWVEEAGAQLWPINPGGRYRGNDKLIEFEDRHLVEGANRMLDVYTYNLDDTYDHACWVGLGQVSAELYIASYLPTYQAQSIADVMAALAEQQAKESEERVALIEAYFGTAAEEAETEEGAP